MFNTRNKSGISKHPCIILYIMGYSNYYLHPPVEEPWNFQGRGCINLGISRGGGGLTLEFPGKGAFRNWNSKGRSNSHMEFPEGGVNFMGSPMMEIR